MENICSDEIHNILDELGYDTSNESIIETPYRYAKYLQSFTKKTDKNFIEFCKKNNIKSSPIKDTKLPIKLTLDKISVQTLCQHHMLPFYGTVYISYITNGYILGLSKFKRLVDFSASELTTQEELTQKIAKNILSVLTVKELSIKMECVHTCMIIRGIKDIGTKTITEIYIEEDEKGVYSKLQPNLCELRTINRTL